MKSQKSIETCPFEIRRRFHLRTKIREKDKGACDIQGITVLRNFERILNEESIYFSI